MITSEDRRVKLEEIRQLLRDIEETRRRNGQNQNPAHRVRLAEVDAMLKGEAVVPGAIASQLVFGHPEATSVGGGRYSNLLPIRVADRQSVEKFRVRAQAELDKVQTKISTAEATAKGRIDGSRKEAKAYLMSQRKWEDECIRNLIRFETLPELKRLHDLLPETEEVNP